LHALGADVDDFDVDRGHCTLCIPCRGTKVTTIPPSSRTPDSFTAAALDADLTLAWGDLFDETRAQDTRAERGVRWQDLSRSSKPVCST